ncbi:MAG: hypothetical protein ACTSX2_05895 [Candidatus Thorarchaeota archaeon]
MLLIPILLVGLELLRYNLLARMKIVSNRQVQIQRMLIVLAVLLTAPLPLFVDLHTVEFVELLLLIPIISIVLLYNLYLMVDNPFRLSKPEFRQGSRLMVAGFTSLLAGESIVSDYSLLYSHIGLAIQIVSLSLIFVGGIIKGFPTYAELIEKLPVSIIIVDKQENIQFAYIANGVFEKNEDETMQIASTLVSSLSGTIRKFFATGVPIVIRYSSIMVLNPSGTYQVEILPHHIDIAGNPISAVIMVTNITDTLKNWESDEISDLILVLIEERKRTNFYIDLISHDMANNLQATLIGLELLASSASSDLKDIVNLSFDGLEKAIELTQTVKGLGKLVYTLELAPVNLYDEIESVFALIRKKFPSTNIMFELEEIGKTPPILADNLLRYVFESLITECILSLKTEEPVEVRIKPEKKSDTVTVCIGPYCNELSDEAKDAFFKWEIKKILPLLGTRLLLTRELVTRYSGQIVLDERSSLYGHPAYVFDLRFPAQKAVTRGERDTDHASQSLAP